MEDIQIERTTEQIWRELSNRLLRFIRSRVTSASDADDILQTVFTRIHERAEDLHEVRNLESWVFQITRNAIADHFRRISRNLKRSIELDVTLLPKENPDEEDNFNTIVEACLGTLIERLPTDQKRAITMYELENISQKEIAVRESISLSGTKSRVQRGRKKLETMLRDCCKLEMDRRGNILQCGEDGCGCENK